MAENLLSNGQFYNEGPYVHSKAYHFRQDVSNIINTKKLNDPLTVLENTSKNLDGLIQTLRGAANDFLVDWDGDYKRASQELFLGINNQTEKRVTYRGIANKLLNSRWFIDCVKRHSTENYNKKEVQQILKDIGLKNTTQAINNANIDTILYNVVDKHIDTSKNSSRAYLKDESKQIISMILKEEERVFFKNKDSFVRQLKKRLKKEASSTDWDKVFTEYKQEFLIRVQKAELDSFQGEIFIDKIKSKFIEEGKKLKAADLSNIKGAIGENLEIAILNNSEVGITAYSTGELDEVDLVKYAKKIFPSSDISEMSHRNVKGRQSGSDWLIENSKGMVVRAQVKNSTDIIEELRDEGGINRPQILKLQDEIYYSSFKKNLQDYRAGKQGGLSEEDWWILDYLIANLVWIRAGGAVTKDAGGNYTSGVSGIMDLINRMLSQEVGYFLGISLAQGQENSVNAVVGGSNIFFVIDNQILYPTWMIVASIKKFLLGVKGYLAKLQITIGTDFQAKYSKSDFSLKKENIKQTTPLPVGGKYGDNMLKLGREQGYSILNSLKIGRGNLSIDIDKMLSDVYRQNIDLI